MLVMIDIFRNLLENAILYNRPEGTVTIRLERQPHAAVATVAATGPSIPAAALPHLFERFYRGEEARRRQPAGCGLGLAIVEQVVRRHAGTVMVASHPGSGSTFTVRLPLAAVARVGHTSRSRAPTSARRNSCGSPRRCL